ncbi:hypothetical protein L580_1931 [Serratia fonticola AU-P3(3)]|nr:hypothetical protein L580_1931 [Serratia fonticola AU-P3(3)]
MSCCQYIFSIPQEMMFFTNDQSAILSNYEIHFSFTINSFYFPVLNGMR